MTKGKIVKKTDEAVTEHSAATAEIAGIDDNSKTSDTGLPNNYLRRLKRQTAFFVGLALTTLLVFLAISLYNNITAARYRQVDMVVDSLLDYPTKMAANLIAVRNAPNAKSATRAESLQQLQLLVDEVTENEYVISLNIFAGNGRLISSSLPDYMAQLASRDQYVEDSNVRVFLKPIMVADKQAGFIQLKYAYQDMLNTFTIFQFDTTKSILLLFMLLLSLGVIIGITINRVHNKVRSKR